MPVFPLLAQPDHYFASTFPMVDEFSYLWWVDVFERHLPSLVRRCHQAEQGKAGAEERIERFHEKFTAYLEALKTRVPESTIAADEAMTAIQICLDREAFLREQDIADPYVVIKREENLAALRLLPDHLKWLDQFSDQPETQVREIIAGVFAGNLFDLGASNTTAMYERGEFDFHQLQEQLALSNWLVDDSRQWIYQLHTKPWKKAMVFIDNAGADLVLGMLPLIRHLLYYEVEVVVAANSEPSLNDVILPELNAVLQHVSRLNKTFADGLNYGQLSTVASGCITPEIDLSQVSEECAAVADGVDLVVLEGMGRSVETNWEARFTCDVMKIATIKEGWLAQQLGGKQYDPVCHYELAY